MERSASRWVLAFDASCGTCRQVSTVVARTCEGKLEVLPLAHPDVERWRAEALGAGRPWAPTLIKVAGDRVRAWTTGPAMGLHLVTRLGPRSVVRLLTTFGQLDRAEAAAARGRAAGTGMRRAAFLRLVVGTGVAVGLVVAGRTPAFARGTSAEMRWVEANADRLPRGYEELSGFSPAYRRAIFTRLSPATRSQLWVEHLARYAARHPELTAEHRSILDRASAMAAEESTFQLDLADRSAIDRRAAAITTDAMRVFGRDEARLALATLGPAADGTEAEPDGPPSCSCQSGAPFCVCLGPCDCGNPPAYYPFFCYSTSSGCGYLWLQPCDGRCESEDGCQIC